MSSIRITGHLLATSYWHVTSGGGSNDNVTRVMRSGIVGGAMSEDGSAPEKPPTLSDVPLVPSNSVRGRLRRHTLSILVEALMARGETLTKDAYQMLSNGGMVGGGEDNQLTVGELVRARKNVHFGLWGGGPRLIPSAVITCDLMPVCAETISSGRVAPEHRGFAPVITRRTGDQTTTVPAAGWNLIQTRIFKRNDDMLTVNSEALARLSVLGPDSHEVIAAYQAEQMAFSDARKQAKSATEGKHQSALTDDEASALKKRTLTHFLEMEVVVPGTVWPVDMRLQSWVSPAQLALFIRGLERLVNEQQLGGFKRWGFGQYNAYLDITAGDQKVGRIQWDAERHQHTCTMVDSSYDDALRQALASVDSAELSGFANAGAPKAPKAKPAKGAGKVAAKAEKA